MGKPAFLLSSELIRSARSIASSVSLPTIKQLESKPGAMAAHGSTAAALRKALESAGVEFIYENGGGPGVRLRKRQQKNG